MWNWNILKHLPVQSQKIHSSRNVQCQRQCLCCYLWTYFTSFSNVLIVEFEQMENIANVVMSPQQTSTGSFSKRQLCFQKNNHKNIFNSVCVLCIYSGHLILGILILTFFILYILNYLGLVPRETLAKKQAYLNWTYIERSSSEMNVVYMFNKVRALWKITWLETHLIGVKRVNQQISWIFFKAK